VPWQDFVISGVGVVFIIALLPAVLKRQPPPVSTGLITGSGLATLAFVFATLSLWFSVVVQGLTAALWYLLAFMAWRA
jgi:hypothetical protein